MTPPLHTGADWRRAYDEGARPQDLLGALAASFQADDPAWILRCTLDFIRAQVAALPPRGPATPLWGLPFAVKDNIDVAGLPTTAACPTFAYQPEQTATAVRRLQAAGAVLVGKTNLDQFATGLVGTRSPYGEVPNSFDARYVSGGSSSGSASVVARGLVPFALGTDTAGSGRVPAGFNNLVGLKPSPGRVPMAGVLPACRTLDVLSVFALTVADAAAVMAVMEGADDEPRFAWPELQPPWLGGSRAALRLGVPADPGCDAALGFDRGFDQARARARDLGAELVTVDFAPLYEVAQLLYGGPWVAERHAVVQALLAQQPEALDATVADVIRAAHAYNATAAFRARYRLEELRAALAPLWQRVDALMVPTAPTCPTHEAVAQAPVQRNSELGRYTNFVNLLGWAALALPVTVPSTGLPFGVTFIAPGGADAALAHWGLRWETAGPGPLGARLREAVPADLAPTALPAAAPTLQLAVVGAHLQGLPLHGQLVERGARLLARTRSAPRYRLHALPGSVPPKPGLARVAEGETGHAIALEVYELPTASVGSFLALIPPPLGLGNVQLEDGRWVKGFICEGAALAAAPDVSGHGGWRAYLAAQAAARA
ncbi:allophanate hydrolase [Burkholderiales bacterium JOSHI_001]|nr:allophanate hydrolase [Burkholderiales bacterium JOSHI_001]